MIALYQRYHLEGNSVTQGLRAEYDTNASLRPGLYRLPKDNVFHLGPLVSTANKSCCLRNPVVAYLAGV